MRTWKDLSGPERDEARNLCLNELLQAVVEGLRFDDARNGDWLQESIDRAVAKAEAMGTPWFVGEYIMDEPHEMGTVGDELRRMAEARAEYALYPRLDEDIVRIGTGGHRED